MEKIKVNPENTSPTSEAEKTAERVFLGKTKDGVSVYDRDDSHFHSEGGLTPELFRLAIEAIDTKGKYFIKEQVQFDRVIGLKTCVEVGPDDEIVMAYRKTEKGTRLGPTPMVKNREGEPCDSITAIIKRDRERNDGSYLLSTGYIGEGSPKEPWDPSIKTEEERKESKEFWDSHALIYDDSQIDWEKTKALEFMSEPAKRAERIWPKVFYAGLFVDPEDLYGKIHPTLEKTIECPHVTTQFKPNAEQLHLDQLGSGAKIYAIGYGNDGKNEGLLVRVEADDPVIQQACDELKTPHITLSVSKNGQPKDTVNLEFSPLETPFELTGEYGLFAQGSIKNKVEDLL